MARMIPCDDCRGRGNDKQGNTCRTCNGTGKVQDNR